MVWGSRGTHKIPFHKGIPGIQTTNPNHQVTISWRDLVYHISTPELPSFMRPIDRATTGAWQLSAHWISKKTKKTREPGLYLMDQESCDMRPTSSDNHLCHVHFHGWNVCCMWNALTCHEMLTVIDVFFAVLTSYIPVTLTLLQGLLADGGVEQDLSQHFCSEATCGCCDMKSGKLPTFFAKSLSLCGAQKALTC